MIDFNASSRLLAENIEEAEMGTSEVDFDLKIIATFRRNLREELDEDSHEKARVAKSRTRGDGASVSSARAPNQVKVLAWPGNMVKTILVTDPLQCLAGSAILEDMGGNAHRTQ
ncbi:hypothetical protein VTN49DRAFT_7887 [Thermomyces lanuginosus]|uniref:uncharacterized protein n=1 Tax=Thermomyces lanuginosus TaxID=5541 RepID=UPI0037440D3F